MKKFFKRLAVMPLILILVAVSILAWLTDIILFVFSGNYKSTLREAWEKSSAVDYITGGAWEWCQR